ncbi:hypothetical protein [Salirhabdus sp. Marseille-P4669]|uniref:hypothetical protein n=1 Tax=Salirhabdus sp. Marseille-P4669 TaxID=2042310 RepID=UPI000C799D14|nr:hypothetical protein [Salirhabdus sp. Marseille-P4669]
MLNLVMSVLLFFFLLFKGYQFLLTMGKLKKPALLPSSEEENASIRKYPEKIIKAPTYREQKAGIIINIVLWTALILIYLLGLFVFKMEWYYFLPLLVPTVNASEYLNLFAVTHDGIISGSRFIKWKNVKSLKWKKVDIHNKFYGYSQEVNDKFELYVETRGFPVRVFVTDDDVKEKLTNILNDCLK